MFPQAAQRRRCSHQPPVAMHSSQPSPLGGTDASMSPGSMVATSNPFYEIPVEIRDRDYRRYLKAPELRSGLSSASTSFNARSTAARVWGSISPIRRSRRLRETPRIPRGIAALSASTPAVCGTGGRNLESASELESGTVTISSSSLPVTSPSAERTIAGRFLPGSPFRAAPNATSQISPRRGASVEAIIERRFPKTLLGHRLRIRGVGQGGFTLRAKCLASLGETGEFGDQRGDRDSLLPSDLAQQVTGVAR